MIKKSDREYSLSDFFIVFYYSVKLSIFTYMNDHSIMVHFTYRVRTIAWCKKTICNEKEQPNEH